MNELYFFLSILINLSSALLLYKLFGKNGLFAFVGFATILANIQAAKTIELFSLTTTVAPSLFASTFLSTDILSENYGKKTANRAVILGAVINILWLIGIGLTILYNPSSSDGIQESLETLFGFIPRITIASLVSYIISQTTDVKLYHLIWKKTGDSKRGLWLRNNGSTLISQLIDTLIFVTIAFVGTVPNNVFWQIMLTTYLFKAIIALLDTPFAYIARMIKPLNEKEKEDAKNR